MNHISSVLSFYVILVNLLFNVVFLIGFACYFCSLCSTVTVGSPDLQHILVYLALHPGVTSAFRCF